MRLDDIAQLRDTAIARTNLTNTHHISQDSPYQDSQAYLALGAARQNANIIIRHDGFGMQTADPMMAAHFKTFQIASMEAYSRASVMLGRVSWFELRRASRI
jgi:hypothetical protein